jgi:cytochrome c5
MSTKTDWKDKMNKRIPVTLVVFSLSLLLIACGDSTPVQEPAAAPTEVQQEEELTAPFPVADGAALLEERCSSCHGLDRVTREQKSHDEWVQTVTRMVARGAVLDEGEQATLVNYLVETYGP